MGGNLWPEADIWSCWLISPGDIQSIMLRARSIASFCLVFLISLVAIYPEGVALAQAENETLSGPTYSAAQLRKMELEGIRLGMSEEAVAQRMSDRGFHLLRPRSTESDDIYESLNKKIRLTIHFTESQSQRTVEYLSYEIRDFSPEEMKDIDSRRHEFLSLLGPPTKWLKWKKDTNEIGDRFEYALNRHFTDQLASDRACFADWKCYSIRENKDCRPIVRTIKEPVIEGGFGYRSLHIVITDYAAKSRTLLKDWSFRRRDTADAVCIVPTVH